MQLNPKSSKAVLGFACGLLVAFFLPWVQLLGFGISGYNLGQLGSYGNYAWIIPILAGTTILVSFSEFSNRLLGAITGIVPLAALLYILSEGVLEVAGHILSIGAYLTIIFSLALIITAFAHPRTPAMSSVEPDVFPGTASDQQSATSNRETVSDGVVYLIVFSIFLLLGIIAFWTMKHQQRGDTTSHGTNPGQLEVGVRLALTSRPFQTREGQENQVGAPRLLAEYQVSRTRGGLIYGK